MGQVFLSWSYHRSKTFQECPRKWFYQYAHRGEVFERKAELLKTLTTPPMVAGQVVQSSIDSCLFEFKRTGRFEQNPTVVVDRAIKSFDELIASSPGAVEAMHRNSKPNSKQIALMRDFYGETAQEGADDRCRSAIRTCLGNWFEGDIWPLIRQVPPAQWMPVLRPGNKTRNFNEWRLEGNTIYSPTDFYFYKDGILHILDWKTGLPGDHGEQLAVYALFGIRHLRQELSKVTVQPVELAQTGKFQPRKVSQIEIDSMEAVILQECSAERSRVSTESTPDGPIYLTTIEMHDGKPSDTKCRRCNFRRICGCCPSLN